MHTEKHTYHVQPTQIGIYSKISVTKFREAQSQVNLQLNKLVGLTQSPVGSCRAADICHDDRARIEYRH